MSESFNNDEKLMNFHVTKKVQKSDGTFLVKLKCDNIHVDEFPCHEKKYRKVT